MSIREPRKKRVGASGRLWILLAAMLILSVPTARAQTYDDLQKSIEARLSQLSAYLLDGSRCLGERLDGYLEINVNCPPDKVSLGEDENRDRKALYALMAQDLPMSPEQIGEERAKREAQRYKQGVWRQVRVDGSVTWWDGRPPPPGLTRILTKHNARLYERPDASSRVTRDNIEQYEAFGVLDSTKGTDGALWYQVTEEYVPKVKPAGWSPRPLGWISEEDSIPWRRALVMQFTNPYQRAPSVFFRTPEAILDLIQEDRDSRARQLETIRSQIEMRSGAGDEVVAMEPQVGERQQRTIMYPVLDFYGRDGRQRPRIDGKYARLLDVAARTRPGGAGGYAQDRARIPIDVVFVMDTTHSMKPYLENVLAATEELASAEGGNGIKFGFIGYQDKKAKGFDYEVKEFTHKTQSAPEFVRTLRGVEARPFAVKGDDIPESVFPAIERALESAQWRDQAIKVIFLVGDAPDHAGDLELKRLRRKAKERDIRIFAFHIKNSEVSKAWDTKSRSQYKGLSTIYLGAEGTGKSRAYFNSIDAGAAELRRQVSERFGEARKSLDGIRESLRTGGPLPAAESGSLSELIFQQAVLMMPEDNMPANEVHGWVSDKVLTDPDRDALEPMILLTEAELDELAARVRELLDVGERALRGEGETTLDFFELVSRNTKFTMVDPKAVNFRDAFSAPLGIDQLPYKSDIMAATRDEFRSMDKVRDFVAAMRNKLDHYEDLRRRRGDPGTWKKLSSRANASDWVVAVALDSLP